MTSLSVSIRLMTRASCETEWTWMVAVTTAVWSGRHADVGGHDVDLVLGHDLGDVAQQPGPVEGLDPDGDRIRLGRRATSHSTSIRRLTSRSLMTVGHDRRWTVTPLPRVMNPTIGSPGIGLQHLAKRTRRSPTPLTRTPPVRSSFWGGATVGSVPWHVVDDAEPHDDRLGTDRAVADGGVEVVDGVVVVVLRDLGDRVGPDGRRSRSAPGGAVRARATRGRGRCSRRGPCA